MTTGGGFVGADGVIGGAADCTGSLVIDWAGVKVGLTTNVGCVAGCEGVAGMVWGSGATGAGAGSGAGTGGGGGGIGGGGCISGADGGGVAGCSDIGGALLV
jgi:hypothetical protein